MLGGTLAALVAAAAWFGLSRTDSAAEGPGGGGTAEPLLLFSSLPLYWGANGDLGAMLGNGGNRHWVRKAIEAERPLEPIDALDDSRLANAPDLLIVQPRPLAPAENVALDEWVARGGRLLLFADPALTIESPFALGDKRRPQDTVLLSPILGRWGLILQFDDDQPFGERTIDLGQGIALPVNLPGRIVATRPGRKGARCTITPSGVLADCRIGRGHAVVVADAALFEEPGDAPAIVARQTTLGTLLARAFAN